MIAPVLHGLKGHTSRVVAGAATLLMLWAGAALASYRTVPRSAANAVAHAITLRPSDVPSLSALANPLTTQDLRTATEAAACEGRSSPRDAFAVAQSDRFAGTNGQPVAAAVSTAAILPSPAIVAHDLTALKQARALKCVAQLLPAHLRATLPANVTIGAPSATRLAPPVSGTDEAVAVRVSIQIRIHQATATTSVTSYTDAIDFGYGQAAISLEVETLSTPPPVALERQLAALLMARARTALS